MNSTVCKPKNTIRSFLSNYVFCLKLIYDANKRNFYLLFTMNFLTLLLPILNLFLARILLNFISGALEHGLGVLEEIFALFVLYAASNILLNFLAEFLQKISILQTQSLLTHINGELIKKSVKIDVSIFDMPQSYDELAKSRENAYTLHEIIFLSMRTFSGIISLSMYLVLCVSHNVYLSIISIIIMIPASYFRLQYERVNYGFDKRQMNEIRKNQYRNGILLGRGSAQELRLYNICQVLISDFIGTTKELIDAKISFSSKRRLKIHLLDLPANLFSVYVKIHAIKWIFNGRNPIGDFIYIDGIFAGLIDAVSGTMGNLATFVGYHDKINDFKKYFAYEETASCDESKRHEISTINEIRFANVYFKYPNTDKEVLRDVSFSIHSGEKAMLVGVNGSGKSTIVKLLTGFYQPSSGDIYINGINMKDLSIDNVRQLQSLVFQDFNTYSFTLRENICLGRLGQAKQTETMEVNDENIRRALDYSGFANVVYNEKKNLDLYINKDFSEDGVVLSGGERQKLVIARSFYRDSDVLVLDEPTAHLDPVSEESIFKIVDCKYGDKISLIITHRLANAHTMDKIIVLDDGRVSDIGRHQDLHCKSSLYTQLYNLQLAKYQR